MYTVVYNRVYACNKTGLSCLQVAVRSMCSLGLFPLPRRGGQVTLYEANNELVWGNPTECNEKQVTR